MKTIQNKNKTKTKQNKKDELINYMFYLMLKSH